MLLQFFPAYPMSPSNHWSFYCLLVLPFLECCIQLTLEQHEFELQVSTYIGFLFFFFSVVNTTMPHYKIYSWLNQRMWIWGYEGITRTIYIHKILTEQKVGAHNSCVVQGPIVLGIIQYVAFTDCLLSFIIVFRFPLFPFMS